MLGPGIRRISGLAVEQVDLTPTLATLMGVPIPAQSTGRVIHEALDTSKEERERRLLLNRDQLLHLLEATYPSQWQRRLDTARARAENTATSGAGLGLPIARRIAEMHAGRVDLVSSRPGRTEFRVTLPVA